MRNEKLIFLFLNQNICCGYSKDSSQWDGSFEHPKHMLKLIGKKIFTILRWHFLFIWACVIIQTDFHFTIPKTMSILTLCLLVSSADNLNEQVKPDQILGLIWIQIVLHYDVIHERVSRKWWFWKKKSADKVKLHLACKELKHVCINHKLWEIEHVWLVCGTMSRA